MMTEWRTMRVNRETLPALAAQSKQP